MSPIIVSDFEAWQYLIRLPKPLLLIADGALELTSEQISAAITKGHRVVIRTSAGHSRGVGWRLEPLNQLATENS